MEYPLMKERRVFLPNHKEFELLSEYSASPSLISEYMRNDLDRATSGYSQNQITVYDCLEWSPFYDQENQSELYFDEKDAIEVPNPQDQTDGTINEPY